MHAMTRKLLTAIATLALGLGGGALLGGCGGSGTKTVSVAEAPPAASAATTPTTTTSTATTPDEHDPGADEHERRHGRAEHHADRARARVRTAGNPRRRPQRRSSARAGARLHTQRHLRIPRKSDAARARRHAHRLHRRLRPAGLLLPRRSLPRHRREGTERERQGASPRATPKSRSRYPLYRPNDPLSSPSGGQAIVRYQLNNGALTPIGRIPPASSTSGLSRN